MTSITQTFPKSLSEIGFEHVDAKTIQVQERTALIARPAHYWLEGGNALRAADAGNKYNAINRGPHQVDYYRKVSWSPVMPNHSLLRDTGNAYPADATHDTVRTTPAYQPLVAVVHAMYAILSSATSPITLADLHVKMCAAKVRGFASDGAIDSKSRNAVRDAIRDLRCYGMALTDTVTVTNKTLVMLDSNASQIKITKAR